MSQITHVDPFHLKDKFWPNTTFYREQRQVIESIRWNDETVVVAGNQLGKDFVAGFVVLWWFLSAMWTGQTCRIVTISVADRHLNVLWGEIGGFISSSAVPLTAKDGGPLLVNSKEIRLAKEVVAAGMNPKSYLIGMVYDNPQKVAGHHSDTSMIVGDEASGLDNIVFERSQGWAKRSFWFGNPEDCPPNHFFKKAVKGGNIRRVAA